MQGRDLGPLVRGERVAWHDNWCYEHTYAHPPRHRIPKTEGVRTKQWKYTRYTDFTPPYEQLFDLAADPQELRTWRTTPPMPRFWTNSANAAMNTVRRSLRPGRDSLPCTSKQYRFFAYRRYSLPPATTGWAQLGPLPSTLTLPFSSTPAGEQDGRAALAATFREQVKHPVRETQRAFADGSFLPFSLAAG